MLTYVKRISRYSSCTPTGELSAYFWRFRRTETAHVGDTVTTYQVSGYGPGRCFGRYRKCRHDMQLLYYRDVRYSIYARTSRREVEIYLPVVIVCVCVCVHILLYTYTLWMCTERWNGSNKIAFLFSPEQKTRPNKIYTSFVVVDCVCACVRVHARWGRWEVWTPPCCPIYNGKKMVIIIIQTKTAGQAVFQNMHNNNSQTWAFQRAPCGRVASK